VHIKDLYSIIVTDKRVECRDFYVRWFDPSGTWIDVIEPIDPAPEFWDKYLA
jgi:hypothetical protein